MHLYCAELTSTSTTGTTAIDEAITYSTPATGETNTDGISAGKTEEPDKSGTHAVTGHCCSFLGVFENAYVCRM